MWLQQNFNFIQPKTTILKKKIPFLIKQSLQQFEHLVIQKLERDIKKCKELHPSHFIQSKLSNPL